MTLLSTAARYLMGLIFLIFGFNGFFQFLPMPPPSEPALKFFIAMSQTGYFLPLLKATEILCGVLLLSGRFVPLALIVLAPIVVQIFAFHIFLDPQGLPMGLFLIAAMLLLGHVHREKFLPLFKPVTRGERSEKTPTL